MSASNMTPINVEAVANRVVVAEGQIKELADTLLGTPKSELAGGGRNPDGLAHKVEENAKNVGVLLTAHRNGGVNAKLRFDRRTSVILAGFLLAQSIGVALIGKVI